MPDRRPALTRADLPAEFTAETVRELPIGTLRRLADHRNGILDRDEQRAFDEVVHQVMRETAERVSRRMSREDWAALRRSENVPGGAGRADRQLLRLARRIGQQVEVAETLAPGVDWSFTQPGPPPPATAPEPDGTVGDEPDPTPGGAAAEDQDQDQDGTVSDLEDRITEQMELVEVMSEIAEMSKRTYALEQQRDLQNTRTVFFGFVVSVAVLVSGWAPLVATHEWSERLWIIGLTVGTVLVAALVYGLIRFRQRRDQPAAADTDAA